MKTEEKYSTVTELGILTTIPYLIFTYHVKRDKKGQMIEDEYENFDIVFVETY